jgi:hypothetical protein
MEADHVGATMQIAAVACPCAAKLDGDDIAQRRDAVSHR